MNTRLTLRTAAAAALISIVISSCANAEGVDTGEAGGGGDGSSAGNNLRVAVAALPTSYDLESNFQATNETYTVWTQTMTNLIGYVYEDEDDMLVQNFTEWEGHLADPDEPFTVSEDGQTYTFHLRDDVVSHAGNPLTAEDVYWSFERKFEVDGGIIHQLSGYFDSIDQVEIIDEHTVEFQLDGAGEDSVFLPVLTGQMGKIWDSTFMQEQATEDDPWATEWAAANPGGGFGPYEVESMTEDQQMVLQAHDGFSPLDPAFDSITLQVVPDSGTRAQLLSSGDVDLAEALTPSDQVAIEETVQLPEVESPIEMTVMALVQNKEPFDDQLVRQAFNYAIPYDEIIEEVYMGRAVPAPGWLIPTMGLPEISDEPAYTYDPERARELLDDAGEETVSLNLTVSNAIPDIVDAALMISSYAEDAGFDVTVEQLAPAEHGTGRTNLEFQSILAANRSQIQVAAFIPLNFFSAGTANNSGFEGDDEFYQLLEDAVSAGPATSEESAPQWQAMQDYLNEEASHLPILYKQPNQAYSTELEGMSYRYDNTVDYSVLTPSGE